MENKMFTETTHIPKYTGPDKEIIKILNKIIDQNGIIIQSLTPKPIIIYDEGK